MDQDSLKLVLAGPVGAGKTTAIRSIADGDPISTEVPMTDGPMGDKLTTTVALDFATVMLDDGTPLLLYGLPGQEHFSFMRSILIKGAVGTLILLNGCDPEIASQCVSWLRAIRDIDPTIGIGVGITRMENAPDNCLNSVRHAIQESGPLVPLFTFDARDRAQARHLVLAMLLSLQ